MKTTLLTLWTLLASALLLPAQTQTNLTFDGAVTLQWDQSEDTNVTGYKIYYGPQSGFYTNVSQVFDCCLGTIVHIPYNVPHFFAARAREDNGDESYDFSNEVGFTIIPGNTNVPSAKNLRIVQVIVGFDEEVLEVPPSIVSQPVGAMVNVGATWSATVTATGSEPISYQWRKGNVDYVNIPGANQSLYTINNVQTNHAGVYSVRVENRVGYVISSNATLVVAAAPPDTNGGPCDVLRGENLASAGWSQAFQGNWGDMYFATSFLSGASTNRPVCRIELELVRLGALQGTLEASIRTGFRPTAASGGVSVPVQISALPSGTNMITFDLPTPALIKPGLTNWVVLRGQSIYGSTNDRVYWMRNAKSSSIGGVTVSSIYKSADGVNWAADTITRRAIYQLFGPGQASDEPPE